MVLTITAGVFAQKNEKSIGLSLGYGTEIESLGIGAKFNYGLTDQIRLSPSFNYFFKKDNVSGWEINADAHYLFNVAPKFNVYPLLGLTLTNWKLDMGKVFGNDLSTSKTRFGLNIGAGVSYKIAYDLSVGAEFKYSAVSDLDQAVFNVNIMYAF